MKNVACLRSVSLAGLVVAAVACGGGGEYTGKSSQALADLYPLADCNAVEQAVRDMAIADMSAQLDANLARALDAADGGTSSYGYGGGADAGASYDASSPSGSSSGSSGTGAGSPPPATADDGSGASSVSHTNNQVASVDEADFIKNDDKYFYIASHGSFRIVQAWPAATMHEIAHVDVEGVARELFVLGNRAVIYSSVQPTAPDPSGTGAARTSYSGYQKCTYAYDCQVMGDGTSTVVTVLDIGDRAKPVELRKVHLSGSFISARRIGDAVHTVVTSPGIVFDGLSYWPTQYLSPHAQDAGADGLTFGEPSVSDQFEALRQKNIDIINSTPLGDFFPQIEDSAAPGAFAGQCSGFYRSAIADGDSFTSVVSLNLASDDRVSSTTVMSRPGPVYASESGLYMTVTHERTDDDAAWFSGGLADEDEVSSVHKFHLGATPGETAYEGSGAVKGHVLSQFSMDEHDGDVRIATSSGHLPDPKTESTVSVLAQGRHGLDTVGVVDHIAPGEDIRAVRFDGVRGFVVTFKKTDPLFVLDLHERTAPSILGELKIPGFSTYMQMMDDTHLLTMGYDADDQGSFAWFAGVRLQIFDVADLTAPRLLHAEVIGTRGSSSEALTDHLAFNYFKERNLLALPMTICEGGDGGGYGTTMSFSGLLVYDVTADKGFSLRGRVAHPQTATGGYDDASCYNWWTQASSEVKRSVFMDNVVYSVSDRRIKANDLNAFSPDLAELPLAP